MPPIDIQDLHIWMQADAQPTLERLANDPDRLARARDRRFERDEPPAYVSSESEGEDTLLEAYGLGGGAGQDTKDLIEPPLDGRELRRVAHCLSNHWRPGARFDQEVDFEDGKIEKFLWEHWLDPDVQKALGGEAGRQRRPIIARRNVRKRWEKLGVWNPQWGIPGRTDQQSNDRSDKWDWRWHTPRPLHRQEGDGGASGYMRAINPFSEAGLEVLNPDHPTVRAVSLRQGLGQLEHVPVPPRPALKDASPAEAESFILSRPWFMYALETTEEQMRHARLPRRGHADPTPDLAWEVLTHWKNIGAFNADSGPSRYKNYPGWKWPHESPSPEPEDLQTLITGDMDFTPSEADALEAIPPPSPREIHPDTLYLTMAAQSMILPWGQEADMAEEDSQLGSELHGQQNGQQDDPQSGQQENQQDNHQENHQDNHQDDRPQLGRASPVLPSPQEQPSKRPRGRPRGTRAEKVAAALAAPTQPLRRSARIAAMAQGEASAPAEQTTQTTTRRRAQRPVPSRPPTPPAAARSGRTPKERGSGRATAISKKPTTTGKKGTKSAGAETKAKGRKPRTRR